jgi:hypothetical protein
MLAAPWCGQRQIGEKGRATGLRALDFQEPKLGANAAGRGKAAEFAAGGEHAMAGHDNREWIVPERLADVAGQQPVA